MTLDTLKMTAQMVDTIAPVMQLLTNCLMDLVEKEDARWRRWSSKPEKCFWLNCSKKFDGTPS
jgi:hypothetical protein